jgi:hypothetical protein
LPEGGQSVGVFAMAPTSVALAIAGVAVRRQVDVVGLFRGGRINLLDREPRAEVGGQRSYAVVGRFLRRDQAGGPSEVYWHAQEREE